MLADALPDDFGNALIDSYMAQRGIEKSQITALDRLAYMGQRALGALEFKPVRGPRNTKPTALVLGALVLAARQAAAGKIGSSNQSVQALQSVIDVGTSAGGARAKAVIAWNPSTEEIRSGQLDAPPGFEHWLLKFDGLGTDNELGEGQEFGRIEYAYYLMAKAAGINISDCRLMKENGRAHFMTKRFDRDADQVKYHMQTLCAMNHLDYKKIGANSYEQLFMTLQSLSLPHADFVEIFRRMAFNVLARNCDDHTKNFSFRLKQYAAWELAPGYDITFAYSPDSIWLKQHLMSINNKTTRITDNDMLTIADRFGVGEAKKVLNDVRGALSNWPNYAKQATVSSVETKRIGSQHLP